MSVSRAVREAVFERDSFQCRYCRKAQAQQVDHIVPVALRRRHKGFEGIEFLVSADSFCNQAKGTRRLAPMGFDLSLLPSTGWRHWDGSAEALRVVVK